MLCLFLATNRQLKFLKCGGNVLDFINIAQNLGVRFGNYKTVSKEIVLQQEIWQISIQRKGELNDTHR